MASKYQIKVLCPVCESEREIKVNRIARIPIVLGSSLWAITVGYVAGALLDVFVGAWLGLVSWVLSFLGLEVYYTLKSKGDLSCPVCEFDPVLYRRHPEQAKQKCLESLKMREDLFLARWKALKNSRPLEDGA